MDNLRQFYCKMGMSNVKKVHGTARGGHIDSNDAKIKTENFMRSHAVQERPVAKMHNLSNFQHIKNFTKMRHFMYVCICLLYTSDAADE